jgi:hypothetical protein
VSRRVYCLKEKQDYKDTGVLTQHSHELSTKFKQKNIMTGLKRIFHICSISANFKCRQDFLGSSVLSSVPVQEMDQVHHLNHHEIQDFDNI